ncbi:MAG: phage holin [Ruminococcus sp.]|nr:phage holin [Ruminococcus sp.]
MVNTIDITPVIEAVITLIVAVITAFVIPWIKSKVSAAKLQNLQEWAALGVNAAEAVYRGTKLGKDKREYVEKYLKDLCEKNGYKYNDNEIRIALEDAWRNMTKEMSEDKTTA